MTSPMSINRRYTASSLDDAASLSPLGSNPSVLHRRSHTGVDASRISRNPRRIDTASNLLDAGSSLYAGDLHDTMLLGDRIRARRARDDVAALIEFLKNHPPPADNFMSIPYDDEDDYARGRWSKIRKIGRRSKSVPRQPPNIRLPDSAVAGMTTGGHRHIAISIPLEATPYGDDMRSQYPVYSHDMQMGSPSKEAVRTYRNEKGVVTVLRPVTEVTEASSDGRSAPPRCRSPYNSQGNIAPRLPPHKPSGSLSGQPHDYIGILPDAFDTPLLDDSTAPWNISRSSSRAGDAAQGKQQPAIFHRAAYPARGSSMVPKRSTRQQASIDGLISSPDKTSSAARIAQSRYYTDSTGRIRHVPLTSDGSPEEFKKTVFSQDGSDGKSRSRSEVPPPLTRNDSQHRTVITITDRPLLVANDDSRPTTSCSTRSRKDIVREKKRRDLEAVRYAKMNGHNRRANKSTDSSQGTPSTVQGAFPADDNKGTPTSEKTTTGASKLTMSNMMVVMDVEPCSTEERDLPPRPKTAPSKQTAKERPESPIPLLPLNSPNMPTPPNSSQGSPPMRQSASDRTSLTRRREWKAIREKERKARDAMAMARTKAQQLASGQYDNTEVTQADKDVMRLYEAYREHRLKDMERRLRRLERNGDVWLQALVPVLESMNKSMALTNAQPVEEVRGWASDDGASGAARATQKQKVTRRSSAHLLEEVTGQKYDEDTWSDSVSRSDDMSGFGTIEPLMRELAAESRRWHGATISHSPVLTSGSGI